jgi:hypothetical protein
MRTRLAVLVVTLGAAAAALAPRSAFAHVAPSVDDNNRYIKLTPLGDRVRLAYTVFYGEIPGAKARATIDADHDGAISDAEGQAFGHKLADEVAAGLDLTVDGAQRKVAWAEVAVGMGTPSTTAGAFSIDLVAWICLPTPRGRHALTLHDHLALTRPGETEVKIEDSLGVTLDRAKIGPADDASHDYRFVGAGGPLADDGLDLTFTASHRAAVTPDLICAAAAPAHASPVFFAGLGAALALVAAIGYLVALRLRARRTRT